MVYKNRCEQRHVQQKKKNDNNNNKWSKNNKSPNFILGI